MLGRRRDDEVRRVYGEQLRAVYAFHAYRVPREVAEDLTQATFERVVRHWGRFDARVASERTWVLSIARNVQIDHFRRQAHRRTASTDQHPALLDELLDVDDPLTRVLQLEGLVEWLRELRPREQEVISLRFGAELSAREVAEMLELSEANVHQIASRGLKRLRELADQPGDSVAGADVRSSAAQHE